MNVSAAWKNAIQQQFRFPAYARLKIALTPAGLREGATGSATNTESITSAQKAVDGAFDVAYPVATFERNRWVGDGSMYLPSENTALNRDMGWWSSNLTATPRSVLTFQFDAAYTIPGIHAIWDSETNTWPTSVIVRGTTLNDGVVEYIINNINSSTALLETPFTDVTKIELTINGWSNPRWRARIAELMFGLYVEYDNDHITSATMLSKASPIASEMPLLESEITFANYDDEFDPTFQSGTAEYLTRRQRATLQWGFNTDCNTVEWMPAQPLYLSEWTIPADEKEVKFKLVSRFAFLTNEYIMGTYSGYTRTFRDLAYEVLMNSGIIKTSTTEIPWELDAFMNTLETRAPAPVAPVNAVLQLIAGASGCMLDINPVNNFVRFRRALPESGYTIAQMQQLGDPAIKFDDRLKSIKIGLYTFLAHDNLEEVYRFEGVTTEETVLEVEYNGGHIVSHPTATIQGATIVSQVFYARRAVVKVSAGQNVVLTINGIIVEESTTFVTTYENEYVPEGLEIVIDNPLITEMATLNVVSDTIKNYYLQRKTFDVPYIGYPELEVGSQVGLQTNYGEFTGNISELQLSFNGGFTGKVIAR